MSELFWLFGIVIIMVLVIMAIPVSIAGIAYLMRKSKRTTIMQTLPPGAANITPVRLNTPRQNDAIIKITGFEFSGVLYTLDNKVFVKGVLQSQSYVYDLTSSSVNWVGTQAQNGFIQWFSLRDASGNMLYVNVETGLFIFRIGNFFPSTRQVYERLFNLWKSVAANV